MRLYVPLLALCPSLFPLIRWISGCISAWYARYFRGVAWRGEGCSWLLCALHLSGLPLSSSLQAPAPESVQGRRSPFSVKKSLFSVLWTQLFPNQVILLPFLQQAVSTLWGRKQRPRGWALDINYLDFSPGLVCFFLLGKVPLFHLSNKCCCSWVTAYRL